MTALDEQPECDLAQPAEAETGSWELRLMLATAVWMLPGCLFGLLARLAIPEGGPATVWLFGGSVVGGLLGGLLETSAE